ncbi:MAG: hypothetical protein HPM95_00515 [Alphaproteobacteria bacterium]|nr:hypothetical protein [Alphaproteobacteria bacterium]
MFTQFTLRAFNYANQSQDLLLVDVNAQYFDPANDPTAGCLKTPGRTGNRPGFSASQSRAGTSRRSITPIRPITASLARSSTRTAPTSRSRTTSSRVSTRH